MSEFYGDAQRVLQDQFDSRTVADVLAAVIVQPAIDDEAKQFIESRSFFFLSTVDAGGHPPGPGPGERARDQRFGKEPGCVAGRRLPQDQPIQPA